MIERTLKVDLDEAIELLQGMRWKFYEVTPDGIRIEFKRADELNVIELPNESGTEKKLKSEGFIKQTKRRVFG